MDIYKILIHLINNVGIIEKVIRLSKKDLF